MYVSGIPDPTSTDISWFKVGPGGNIIELKEPTVNFSSDHRTLLLSNIEPEDGGIYQCIVSRSFLQYRSAIVNINVTVLLFPGKYEGEGEERGRGVGGGEERGRGGGGRRGGGEGKGRGRGGRGGGGGEGERGEGRGWIVKDKELDSLLCN